MDLFKTYTKSHQAPLTIVNRKDITDIVYGEVTSFNYKDERYAIEMVGTHQVYNASLAIEIIHQLEQRHLVRVTNNSMKAGLRHTYWPGRMERFGNVILDGAHNIGGMLVLKDTMETYFKEFYIKVLFTSMADKEYFENIQVL